MAACLIGLGANLGDTRATLQRCLDLVADQAEIDLAAASRFYPTAPIGGPADQPSFLNAAAVLETSLSPPALLAALQELEAQLGRSRDGVRWGPRTIDLDLLLCEQRLVRTDDPLLPHRCLAFRRFVLEPACEVAADWVHPVLGATLGALLHHINNSPRYVALCGASRIDVTGVARAVAAAFDRLGKRAELVIAPPQASRTEGRQELSAAMQRRADSWVISDFWMPHRFAGAGHTGEQPEAEVAESAGDLTQPRLLVILGLDEPLWTAQRPTTINDDVDAILIDNVRGGRHPIPLLSLAAGNPSMMVEEIAAAMLATE